MDLIKDTARLALYIFGNYSTMENIVKKVFSDVTVIKPFLLILFILSSTGSLSAETDSMLAAVNNADGSARVSSRLEYAQLLAKSDFAAAVQQAELAISEAREINDQQLVANSLYTLATLYQSTDQTDSAEKYLVLALPLTQDIDQIELRIKVQFDLGQVNHYRGNNSQAMKFYTAAAENAEMVDNFRLLGACYSAISNTFRVLGAFDVALEYIIRAKSNYQLANFSEGAAWVAYTQGRINRDLGIYDEAELAFQEALSAYTALASGNGGSIGIALCLDQLGLINFEQDKLPEAKPFIQRSLKIYQDENSNYGVSNALKNLGKIEYALGNFTIAKKLLLQSLTYKRNTQDALGIPGIYEYLGLIHLAEGNWQTGIDSLKIGLEAAILNEQRQIQFNIYGRLAQACEDHGNLEEALKFYKLQFELQDLITTNPIRFKLPELHAIYEMEQTRIQIKDLERQNQVKELRISRQRTIQLALFTGGLFLALFLALVLYLYRGNKRMLAIVDSQNSELEGLVATRDKLFSLISHDLRGPIGNLMTYSEVMLEAHENLDREEIQSMLASISTMSANIYQLLDNLLNWAHSQANQLKIEKQKISLAEVIQENADLVDPIAKNKNLDIAVDIPETIVVNIDRNTMSTVFRNLLSNAVKFSHRGGRIEVSGKILDGSVQVEIRDSGIGMGNEVRNNLFNMASMRSETGTEGEKGSGLGLILCNEFVSKNGGKLLVDSIDGSGTTFTIVLPPGN